MGYISPTKPAASCIECLAWGVLPGRYCRACYTYGQLHDEGECTFCHRFVPVKRGYCRLCRLQASLDAKGQVTVLEPFLKSLTHQQLFFARMHRIRQRGGPLLGKAGRRKGRRPAPPPEPQPAPSRWTQLQLPFETRRDYSRFNRQDHADFANPILISARQIARDLGERRGWPRWVTSDVDRALVILLSSHTGSDKIRYSELCPVLRRYGLSAERTCEVLDHLSLLNDDRVSAFEAWMDGKLARLAPAIANDVRHWLLTLRGGGPRSRPRSASTSWTYLIQLYPVLLTWSQCYDHLREVTPEDLGELADTLTGGERHRTLTALRALFRHCKRSRSIFRKPAARIRVGEQPRKIHLPLTDEEIDQAVSAARSPNARLVLALAAIHAARPKAIRELQLDDVDLGNRRLTIAGRARPLDDLTHQMFLQWLAYRHERWPNTANPHLLINQQTALETGPINGNHMGDPFRRLAATIDRLRIHRQLGEALTHGPDPLHPATIFGLDPKTAIRYAENARAILAATADDQDPARRDEPKGPQPT
jgi:integrase